MKRRYGWLDDSVVERQLAAVERLIREAASEGGACPPFHRQLLSERSKRLRPALLLAAARLGENPPEPALLSAAAGLELLHEATLYHDDIVDEAPLRRGKPSTQSACGPFVAACAGSELLFATGELFAELPLRLRRLVGRAADRLCHGQLREVETLGDLGLTARQRVRIMRDKTATLFVLAAEIGGGLAGLDQHCGRTLRRFAASFGLCFQLADDVADLVGPRGTLGRPAGADLRDGVYTLPILYALAAPVEAAEELRERLLALQQSADGGALREARTLVQRAGGIDRARRVLGAWYRIAVAQLDELERRRPSRSPILRNLLAHVAQGIEKTSGRTESVESDSLLNLPSLVGHSLSV